LTEGEDGIRKENKMNGQREIEIDIRTKGTLIFARKKFSSDYEWLILIHSVGVRGHTFTIFSHVSYCLTNGNTFVNTSKPGRWGYANEYDLYEPTKEQRNKILDILKSHKLKFVSILNKMIKIDSH
jgi:hypothetical protein